MRATVNVACMTKKPRKTPDPTIAFRVPPALLEEIDRRAEQDRRRRSDYLRVLLEDVLLRGDAPPGDRAAG